MRISANALAVLARLQKPNQAGRSTYSGASSRERQLPLTSRF